MAGSGAFLLPNATSFDFFVPPNVQPVECDPNRSFKLVHATLSMSVTVQTAAFAQDIEEVHPVSGTPHRLPLECRSLFFAFSVADAAVPFRLEPKDAAEHFQNASFTGYSYDTSSWALILASPLWCPAASHVAKAKTTVKVMKVPEGAGVLAH